MKTIVLREPGSFQFTQSTPPTAPGPGEALVAVRRVGICGTDLHAFRGRQPFFSYPRILGHELGVEVVALGPDTEAAGVEVGDLCAVEPYLNCGMCIACRAGKTNCCTQLQVLGVHTDGGMREQIVVPARKLHVANDAPLDQLALVEMLCIGAHAVRRAALAPGADVLVIGAGPIGLGVMLFAQQAGAHVIGMELSPVRSDFARRHLAITDWVDPRDDVGRQLAQVTAAGAPTTVFDATGNVHSMQQAFNYPAHGGTLVLVGLVQDDITFHDPDFHRRELTVMSSRNATAADFAQVIATLSSGAVDLTPWITHRATPETMIESFPHWLDPQQGVIKAMVEW